MEEIFRGFASFILVPLVLGLALLSIIFYIMVLVMPPILIHTILEDYSWFKNSKIGKTFEDENFFAFFYAAFAIILGIYLYLKFNFRWRTLNDLVYEFLNNIFSLPQNYF